MRPTLLSTCVLFAACGGEEMMPATEKLPPVPIAELSLTPSCYTPFVQLTTCMDAKCTDARAKNTANEAAAQEALAPYVEMSSAIARDRDAPSWTFTYAWPEPHELHSDYTVTAAERGEAGLLVIDVHDHGTYAPGGGELPQEVDSTARLYAAYTPNFAMVDLETTLVRWTAHAVSLGPIYRGCDPAKKVSFDSRFDDAGNYDIYCWDTAGHMVACSTVDLWPK